MINDINYSEFTFDKSDYIVLMEIKTFKDEDGYLHYKSSDNVRSILFTSEYEGIIRSLGEIDNYENYYDIEVDFRSTNAGFLPAKIWKYHKDYLTMVVVNFYFYNHSTLLSNAGFREIDVLNNATTYDVIENKGSTFIKLITDDSYAIFDNRTLRWVG